MSAPAPGRFVWFELNTRDPRKAVAFYTKLFDWKIAAHDMGPMGTYHMIGEGADGQGGMCAMQGEHEGPAHWTGYVTVPSVEEACGRATAHGGKICMPPMDIPNVGRFAVVQDPTGGVLLPFKGLSDDIEPAGPPAPGKFCWSELLTTDVGRARAFYTEVIGWGVKEMPMGEMGTYHLFQRAGKDAAGMMAMPPDAPGPSNWLHYVAVASVDASCAEAKKLGAKAWVEPRDIPGIGRFSVLADPEGAMFALFGT